MDKVVNEVREMIERNWESIKALEKDVQEMKKDMTERKKRVEKLEEKYSMEKHIMVSIVGSKKKMRHYDNIWELFRDPKYKNECEAYLAAYSLTEDDLYDLLMKK
jgi:predicted transcriptional regulator